MPAAPELVLSDVRGPMNATRSQFDVIILSRARAAAADTYRVNNRPRHGPTGVLFSLFCEKNEMFPLVYL
jgi:hypothetical protein